MRSFKKKNLLYIIVCLCKLSLSTILLPLHAQEVITNSIGMEFVLIQPGSMTVGKFDPTVGKPVGDDKGKQLSPAVYKLAEALAGKAAAPGFRVNISYTYYIGKYEVTQEQWKRVMRHNPSVFQDRSDASRYNKHPVENISWKAARAFIQKLNKLDKHYVYRLPSEFEWEYAARAGATDDIAWTDIRKVAVLSGKETSEKGKMQPNAWGIYDMLGNVWEWVADYYNEKLFADPIPPAKGKQHVLKGASFTGDVKNATYMTHAAGPGNGFDVGFRIVMEIKKKINE
jgi:formylglycine-generating enzyme required for sulfatase activity